jgi:hypothetical protein
MLQCARIRDWCGSLTAGVGGTLLAAQQSKQAGTVKMQDAKHKPVQKSQQIHYTYTLGLLQLSLAGWQAPFLLRRLLTMMACEQ